MHYVLHNKVNKYDVGSVVLIKAKFAAKALNLEIVKADALFIRKTDLLERQKMRLTNKKFRFDRFWN